MEDRYGKSLAAFGLVLFFIVLITSLAAFNAMGKTVELGPAEYVSAYDGDTITVNIPSLPDIFGHHLRLRVSHIDAPEMKSNSICEKKAALRALAEVTHLLSGAKKIELMDPKRDKYFRVLSDIVIDGKIILSKHMLDKGLAVPYEGDSKKRVNWCSSPTNK